MVAAEFLHFLVFAVNEISRKENLPGKNRTGSGVSSSSPVTKITGRCGKGHFSAVPPGILLAVNQMMHNPTTGLMKNKFLVLSASAFIAGAILTGCNSPTEKVQKAEEQVDQANKELEQAKKDLEEYRADSARYMEIAARQIAANQQRIAQLREELSKPGKKAQETISEQIDELEKRNNEIREKVAAYRYVRKEQWESFKKELDHDINELGDALRDFTIDNRK